ncbi:hypothetical protein AKO1_012951 [Acrasis kona]|uniref:Uncharacterized protein n=1 Tax=Acrasis kona TaxID=1008807 RepID=A0AAW2YY27_9EUKA
MLSSQSIFTTAFTYVDHPGTEQVTKSRSPCELGPHEEIEHSFSVFKPLEINRGLSCNLETEVLVPTTTEQEQPEAHIEPLLHSNADNCSQKEYQGKITELEEQVAKLKKEKKVVAVDFEACSIEKP